MYEWHRRDPTELQNECSFNPITLSWLYQSSGVAARLTRGLPSACVPTLCRWPSRHERATRSSRRAGCRRRAPAPAAPSGPDPSSCWRPPGRRGGHNLSHHTHTPHTSCLDTTDERYNLIPGAGFTKPCALLKLDFLTSAYKKCMR